MDTYPIAASSLERYYYTDGHQLERQYKEHLSGYEDWEEQEHADKWLVFPDNIGPNMSIDETSLSDGELYTVVSNKDAHGRKGALAAIVWGTKAEVVAEALRNIPLEKRQLVEEITLDLSPSMRSIVQRSFPKTRRTIDRFHIQQLASDAIQEIRIGHRWEALKADHKRKLGDPDTGEILPPEIFPNGDSRPQLLARSRYLLFKSYEKWTDSQKARAKILFKEYPDIKLAYDLAERLRQVFSKCPRRSLAATRLAFDNYSYFIFYDEAKIMVDKVSDYLGRPTDGDYDAIRQSIVSGNPNAAIHWKGDNIFFTLKADPERHRPELYITVPHQANTATEN